jgi:5-methylcytosine-specific restriction endonuclease McrA
MKKKCLCGKNFIIPECRKDTAKYCSIECLRKFRKYGQNKKEWIKKICKCGKNFSVQVYRLNSAKYCSLQCSGRYSNKYRGKLARLNISLSKMGSKNPMFGKNHTKEHKEKQSISLKKHWDRIGRVSKEHKRIIKKILNHKRRDYTKGTFKKQEWEEMKKLYNYTCPCCDKKEPEIKLTIDHIIPLSKGGTNTIDNIQPLCLKCNCKKNNKHNKKYEKV